MNDIERMAREAGFRIFGHKIVAADDGISGQATQAVERFAALVRAQERGRIAAELAEKYEGLARRYAHAPEFAALFWEASAKMKG